ncbi:MAG: LytTR family transcriptional regulator, partial [Clostridia bacterium]|nr:LytTR family transcriptional regulator [Clostridia bacterium]
HKKDTIIPSVTLKKLSSYLNMGIFIRCHQSFILNISNYDRASRTEIIMEGASVPVSRRYSGKVKLIIDEERRKQLWN